MAVQPKVTVQISDSMRAQIRSLGFRFMSDSFADKMGAIIVNEMKRLIASGQSPVKGYGRFAAYKHPEKYPGKKKAHRPVNLSLTGTLLSYLSYRKANNLLEVGFLPGKLDGGGEKKYSLNKARLIARVHNTGERPDIPQRKFIPEEGETFTASINSKIRDAFRKRVLEILKG